MTAHLSSPWKGQKDLHYFRISHWVVILCLFGYLCLDATGRRPVDQCLLPSIQWFEDAHTHADSLSPCEHSHSRKSRVNRLKAQRVSHQPLQKYPPWSAYFLSHQDASTACVNESHMSMTGYFWNDHPMHRITPSMHLITIMHYSPMQFMVLGWLIGKPRHLMRILVRKRGYVSISVYTCDLHWTED